MSTPDPDLSHLLVELPVPADGPDRVRRQARRRRRLRAAAGTGSTLLAAAAVVAVVLVPADDARRVQTAMAPTSVDARPPQPGPRSAGLPVLDDRTGAHLVLRGGVRPDVPGDADTTVVLDVDRGRVRPFRLPVPGGDTRVREVVRRVGGYAVVVAGDGAVHDVYFVDEERHSPPVHLGEGTSAFPSLVADRIWLAREGDGAGSGSTVVEVDMGGAVTTPPATIPCCRRPLADVEGGILTETRSGSLQVWSLRLDVVRRVLATDSRLVATTGDVVAVVADECAADGGLALVTVATGERRPVALDGGGRCVAAGTGRFSAGADWLAVHLVEEGGAAEVAMIDVAAATGTLVPDSAVVVWQPLAWSGTGPWLFFVDPVDDGPDGTPLRAVAVRDVGVGGRPHVVPARLGWLATVDLVAVDWFYVSSFAEG